MASPGLRGDERLPLIASADCSISFHIGSAQAVSEWRHFVHQTIIWPATAQDVAHSPSLSPAAMKSPVQVLIAVAIRRLHPSVNGEAAIQAFPSARSEQPSGTQTPPCRSGLAGNGLTRSRPKTWNGSRVLLDHAVSKAERGVSVHRRNHEPGMPGCAGWLMPDAALSASWWAVPARQRRPCPE